MVNEESSQPVTHSDVLEAWAVVGVLWLPIVMHLTGTLLPTMELVTDFMIDTLSRFFDLMGVESSASTSTGSDAPSSSDLSPGAFVLVGIIQLLIGLFILLAVLVFGIGAIMAGLMYVYLLVMSVVRALKITNEYYNQPVNGGTADA